MKPDNSKEEPSSEKEIETELEDLAASRVQDADLATTVARDEKDFAKQERQNQIDRAMAIHAWRKTSLVALFVYLFAWSVAILALVFLSGAKPALFDLTFGLSDSVLITLLTTTLAQVIGLLTIAFKWLFPREGK